MVRKSFLSVCLFVPPLVFSSLIFSPAPLAASDLAEVAARGTLRMLCFPHIESHFVRPDLDALRASGGPLVELKDPAAYSGLDIEIMGAFASSLGVELDIVPIVTNYGDLIEGLIAGRGDVAASSLTITEARSRRVDFSAPYLQSWVVVGVPPGSDIRSINDLAGRRVAVMRGSSQLEYIEKLEIPDLEKVYTSYSLENYEALEDERADFALFDSPAEPGQPVMEGLAGATVAFRLRPFGYGVAVRPGSDLRDRLDRFLEDFRSSGRLAAVLATHRP